MRILITGGAGFIGSHLAEALLAGGHEVFVLDDLSTGRIDNIVQIKGHDRFHYTIDSVLNEQLVAELVDRAAVIFHLAATEGVRLTMQDPVHAFETNVRGTEVVLRHAARKRKLVIVGSTSEVYGKGADLPLRETADLVLGATTHPRWAYAASKAVGEFLALAQWQVRQLPVVIVRFFDVAGPRGSGTVVPTFVGQALAGDPITVFGTGMQARCIADIGDVVGALQKLMIEPRAIGEVFNVGTTEQVTIRALAERVKAMTGSVSPIVTVPYEDAYGPGFEELPSQVPDLGKIEQVIGYRPRVGLDAIIRRVVESQRDV